MKQVLLLLILLPLHLRANELDDLARDTLQAEHIPGFTVLVSKDATDLAVLDPEYAAKLKTSRGKRALARLSPVKDATSLAFLEIEPSTPDRIFRYRAQTGGKSFVVAFVVTKQSQVYSVAVREEAS